MKIKEVVDDLTMKRAITRITYEIIERNEEIIVEMTELDGQDRILIEVSE